ncbi:MAG: potassium channel family protein [Enterococcus sp.]
MLAFLVILRNMFEILKILFKQQEQKAILSAGGLLLVVGTFFYHNIEGMHYLDALYFCVMTLATVGYGDFHPETAFGKLFTIFYVLIGVGIITGLVANMNRAMIEFHKQKKNK